MKKKMIAFMIASTMGISILAGCGGAGSAAGTNAAAETESLSAQSSENTGALAEGQEDASAAGEAEDEWTWDMKKAGIHIAWPDYVRKMKGQICSTDIGDQQNESEVCVGVVSYFARTKEECDAMDALEQSAEELTPEQSQKMNEFYEGHEALLLMTVAIKKDSEMTIEQFIDENLEGEPIAKSGDLGKAGDYKFYYIAFDYTKPTDEANLAETIPEEMFAELTTLMEDMDNIISCIQVKTPVQDAEAPEEGAPVSFETTDLEGNAVKSADIFKDHKVTMINIWATWCGPCIGELAELEALNKEFAGKDCQIIGICEDAGEDKNKAEKAAGILTENGVTYTNLTGTDEIMEMLHPDGFPTSYFVDSEGNILTTPVTGADLELYPERLEEALAKCE